MKSESELRRIAGSWVRAADKVKILGDAPADGEAVHVTVIVSGPPKVHEEKNG